MDSYYCDDCGKSCYTSSEAELCEIEHMTDKLVKMTDERDVESLLKLLEQREKLAHAVTAEIIKSLGIIGDNRATVPLIQIIEDAKFGTRAQEDLSIDELRNIGLYGSKSPAFQKAVEALGKIGDSRALVPIMNIFLKLDKGSFEPIYNTVANALKGIPDVEAEFERLEAYEKAEEWYIFHNRHEEAANMREKKGELAAPKTEIHGDYVDDRDTIVKDSVINRSNVGAGKSKSEELREAKALLDDGIIDDAEFKQMKKEILGK